MVTRKVIIGSLLAFFAIPCCLGPLVGGGSSDEKKSEPQKVVEAKPVKSQEEIEREEKQKVILGAQGMRVIKLRDSMHDPSSFDLVSAFYIEDAGFGTLCVEYRAKNGFGAVRKNHVVFYDGIPELMQLGNASEKTKIWNEKCSNKQGRELAPGIKRVL